MKLCNLAIFSVGYREMTNGSNAHVDAIKRSRRLFEIVVAIRHFSEHDRVRSHRVAGRWPFPATSGVVEPVGKQRDPT